MKNVGNRSCGRSQGVMKIFKASCIGRIARSSLRWHSFLVLHVNAFRLKISFDLVA